MAKHYPFGGSSAARTLACPGWVKAAADIPRQPSSIYAKRGTDLHALMEKLYRDELKPADLDFPNADYEDAIHEAFGATETLLDAHGLEFILTEPLYEGRLADTGGSIDMVAWNGSTTLVLDFKFGQGEIHAEENAQLLFYLWLLWHNNPKIVQGRDRQLLLAIIQPGTPVEVWQCSMTRLKEFDKQFTEAYRMARREKPPMVAGGHCRWCPARPYCKENQALAHRAVSLDPSHIDSLSESLELAYQLESWVKEVFAEAQLRLEQGIQVPGVKLVEKRATRKWSDAKAAEALALSLPDSDRFFRRTLLSPAQMDKLKLEGSPFEPLVVKESSGVTIARDSDKRQAIPIETPEALLKLVKNS